MSTTPRRQPDDTEALAASRAAAQRAWLVEETYAYEILEEAVAACAYRLGGHEVRRVLPDLDDGSSLVPPAAGWPDSTVTGGPTGAGTG
jgi:hypothetical protein